MKLDAETLVHIHNVIKTAQLAGIDRVIFEPGKIRAMDESRTVVLLQDKDVPALPFDLIGINRISTFLSRFDIAKSCKDFTVEALVESDQKFVRSLVMKGKGVKVDFRCANPTTIEAPKQINDTLKHRIAISSESISLLGQGKNAMRPDVVTVLSNEKGVFFELADVNSDVLSISVTDKVTTLTDDPSTKFAHRYPVELLLTLLKSNSLDEKIVEIGQKGILKITINKLNVYVLPQV